MTIAPPEPADALDDAELALAAARGDQIAFGAIYDRYADRLYDFCVGMLRDRDAAADCVQDVFVTAATKLVQLQDPDRLRAWLYAIARHAALARIRDRRRELPSDELPETVSGEADLATVAARNELAALIAEACGGLSDRDRTVYELAYRHGLDGPELADALGVTHTNANTLVGRLRDGIERSLGALLVCRGVKADPAACPELASIVGVWDGTFTVLMRKRAARHIDGCAACESARRRMVNPVALLGGAPLFLPAPAVLRGDVLADASAALNDIDDRERHSAPSPSAMGERLVRAALSVALVVLGIAGVAQLFAPLNGRVEQVRAPFDPSMSPVTLSIAGITPPSTLDPATTSAPVTTATNEPSQNVTAEVTSESDAPTLTTAPTSASTSRTTPKNSFVPSRLTPTATRTSESEESTTTTATTSSSASTSTRTSSSTSTTTTTSDPIE